MIEYQGAFHMFLCARSKNGPYAGRGVIAHAISKDLVSWDVQPPVYQSRDYGFLEVPDVFCAGNRWYLVFSVGEWHSVRKKDWLSGASAIRYLVADSPVGPYFEPEDNVLVGSPPGSLHNYVGRTLADQVNCGEDRVFYYHNVLPNRTDAFSSFQGMWAMPKRLKLQNERPQVVIDCSKRDVFRNELTTTHVGTESWHTYPLPDVDRGRWGKMENLSMCGQIEVGISCNVGEQNSVAGNLRAKILVQGRQAGFLMNYSADRKNGTAVLIDPQQKQVSVYDCYAAEFGWSLVTRYGRSLPNTGPEQAEGFLEQPVAFDLELVYNGHFLDVYVNEILMASVFLPNDRGAVGFMVESGEAEFRDIDMAFSDKELELHSQRDEGTLST